MAGCFGYMFSLCIRSNDEEDEKGGLMSVDLSASKRVKTPQEIMENKMEVIEQLETAIASYTEGMEQDQTDELKYLQSAIKHRKKKDQVSANREYNKMKISARRRAQKNEYIMKMETILASFKGSEEVKMFAEAMKDTALYLKDNGQQIDLSTIQQIKDSIDIDLQGMNKIHTALSKPLEPILDEAEVQKEFKQFLEESEEEEIGSDSDKSVKKERTSTRSIVIEPPSEVVASEPQLESRVSKQKQSSTKLKKTRDKAIVET